MTPFFEGGHGRVVLWCGDALEVLRELPDESIHCVVTSPPYWRLRRYLDDDDPMKSVELGGESTLSEYVAKLVDVFREVRRVLRRNAVCWVNLGDRYASQGGDHAGRVDNQPGVGAKRVHEHDGADHSNRIPSEGLKPKDLCMIPARVALALQADGWYLRSDIIWHKPNPMPESVTDRPTKSYEHVFMLTRSSRYYYDAEAVKEPVKPASVKRCRAGYRDNNTEHDRANHYGDGFQRGEGYELSGRNLRDVWTIPTEAFPEAHFGTYPQKLMEPCILAGSSASGCCTNCGSPWKRILSKSRTFESGSGKAGHFPKEKNGPNLQGSGETLDVRRGPCVHSTTLGWSPTCKCGCEETVPCTILDPFCGVSTTGLVALRLGRRYVGIDVKAEYLDMGLKRLADQLANPKLLEVDS